jgi:hypothetical protein
MGHTHFSTSLGQEVAMRARAAAPYRDGGLAEIPRPPSHNDNGKAERKPVSLYACRATVLMLSKDNYIGQSVAEHPSRLEFPARELKPAFFVL